ncbi:SDR family NAD(P)-dependent oxidoreductase [Marinomonas algicola]|uniref:SDR family NAD(P)-dependent oxidoreductase n=1 Tax=Marinomonas algicola TaxID=2773454 RepID=UPI0017488C78|nr:SDR family NAD(P)-dependent oxidoreductase [Marinomonas algicola]
MQAKTAQLKNETIWITGGSSGIGYALVAKLAEHNKVIVSARDQSKLEAMSENLPNVSFVVFDVSDKTQIDRVTNELSQITPHIDRAILNAGHCEYLDIDQPDWDIMERMMAVNFLGMVNSLHACLSLLKKAPHPHLIGVSSQAIAAPFTQAEGYGASKAAIQYWLASLRIDLVKFNIDVTSIMPGFVDTPLTQKNTFDMPFIMNSEQAATRIIDAIDKRVLNCAFPKRLSAMLWFARKMPRSWMKLQQPK